MTMLSLGINQHARQLTISLRNEHGDVVQARQVSTQSEKIQEFFERLSREHLHGGELFLAVVEVCGFNDWLLQALEDHHCHKVTLIPSKARKRQKTDRRDASALSELLTASMTCGGRGFPRLAAAIFALRSGALWSILARLALPCRCIALRRRRV